MLILIGLLVYHIALLILSKFFPKTKFFDILKLALFVLPIILICSLKSINVGNDTPSYLIYYNSSINREVGYDMIKEKGFYYLMFVMRSLNAPFFVFLLVVFTFVYTCCAIFCYKKSQNPLLTLFFICYFGLLGFSLSGIRQSIAIGFILLGFSFFKYKKPVSIIAPLLAILCAFFFHRTSVLVLPVCLLLLFDMKKNSFMYILLACLIIGLSAPFVYSYVVVSSKSTLYPSREGTFFTLIIYALFAVLLIILSLPKFKETESRLFKNSKDNWFVNLLEPNITEEENEDVLSFRTASAYIVYPLVVLIVGIYSSVFSRITYYSVAFTGLLLINTINNKKFAKQTRVILTSLLVVFLCGYYAYAVLLKDPLTVSHYSFGPIMF